MSQGIKIELRELLALRHYVRSIPFNKLQSQSLSTLTSGNHLSIARGRGMEFEEVRQYHIGDDVRFMHWNLTARLGKPFIKLYREERERCVYIITDMSYSMEFGTKVCFKSYLAAKLCAIIGWAALSQSERVGGIVFNDDGSEFIPPKRSHKSLLKMFNLLIHNKLHTCPPNLNNALNLLLQNIDSGSLVILLSDYKGLTTNGEKMLKMLAQKCKVINVLISDTLERHLPQRGEYSFVDYNNKYISLNMNNTNNKIYTTNFLHKLEHIKKLSYAHNMQFLDIKTDDNLLYKIAGLFKHG